jgi:hypothetical protein
MLQIAAEIKLAGSVSLAVSVPTMLVGLARYSRVRSWFSPGILASPWQSPLDRSTARQSAGCFSAFFPTRCHPRRIRHQNLHHR